MIVNFLIFSFNTNIVTKNVLNFLSLFYLFFFLFAFKCTILNEKLNLLLNTLSIESEALPSSSREELSSEGAGMAGNGNGRQKVFVPKEALMSRANSLKKALKQIIEHAEQGMSKSR